jgi:sterol desaturase/sphingolipid hydroxylase (fatty acid hydroxylase superfamily)
LNVLNTSRFHPLETSLQFLCDTAPFILLGVSAEVLSLYFVLHASKGFLQHSNLDVRLGLANRLISGPELHRLHHSLDPTQSRSNFGNKLSIWDLIWGTYLDPANQVVSTLGIEVDEGQAPFSVQFRQPFRQLNRRQGASP